MKHDYNECKECLHIKELGRLGKIDQFEIRKWRQHIIDVEGC